MSERGTFTYGDYIYSLRVDGTAKIQRYTGCEEVPSIPDVLDGHAVTSIGQWAFATIDYWRKYGNECRITGVVIPDNVTAIDDRASEDCVTLRNITIPDGVTSIGMEAFAGCVNLASIRIPPSITAIGQAAFCGCTSLTSIPNSPQRHCH